MNFSRIGAVAGFGFVALAVTNGALLGSPPFPETGVTAVRGYVESDQVMHKAGLLALVFSLPFAAVFYAGVIDRLGVSDRQHNEPWRIAALIGAVLTGSAVIVGDVLYALLVYRAGSGLDDSALQLLKDGELIAYSAMGIAVATVAGSVAVPTFLYGALPRWHGVLAFVVIILSLANTIGMVSDTDAGGWVDVPAKLGFAVWVLATSLVLLREPRKP